MARSVLIDTSALVAARRRKDVHHHWARSHFEAATEPFLTCEAVISESFFLLERAHHGKETLCALLERAVVVSRFSLVDELPETLRLLRRQSDTPMSFADACLVRMAEKGDEAVVFTADSDFRTYRKNGRQVIPLITPDQLSAASAKRWRPRTSGSFTPPSPPARAYASQPSNSSSVIAWKPRRDNRQDSQDSAGLGSGRRDLVAAFCRDDL